MYPLHLGTYDFARWDFTCHRFGGAHSMTYLMQLHPKRAYPDSTLDQRRDQVVLLSGCSLAFDSAMILYARAQDRPFTDFV